MKRVTYISAFTTSVDHQLNTSEGITPATSVGDAHDQFESLDKDLFTQADQWCKESHFPSMQSNLEIDENSEQPLHCIQSVVGDDEVNTTNSQSLGPLLIVAGPLISRVILSKKDTGISPHVMNYAEGWIVIPPTRESCFEAVNRRHAGEGVPFVLDGVKLKLISAVRKQSKLELDLESKMQKVIENASWVHRNWFTYDYHQMMVILAMNVFDFRDSRSFPFLYPTEGGCGGLPPYGNIETVMSAMHAFHKGKAKRTILGIAHEATECHLGRLKPNETFFIRSSHIAQMGDKAWLIYDQVYRSLLKGTTATEAKNRLNVLAEKESLPMEILEKGAEISPDNIIVGTAISHLRSDNFIMTELDVKMYLENLKKIQGLSGTKPYREILADIEEEKEKFKSNSWTVLARLSELFTVDDYRSLDALESISMDPKFYPERQQVLQDYYAMRSEKYSTFTAFAYTDAIRVFKTSDVYEYVRKSGNVLRSEVALQISDQLRMSFTRDIYSERLRKESIFNWLNSKDLNELLHEPLPPGVGPDDARILVSVLDKLEEIPRGKQLPVAIIIVTSDRGLAREIAIRAREKYSDKKWVLFQMDVTSYIRICLEYCKQLTEGDVTPTRNDIMIYNYIVERSVPLPRKVKASILSAVQGLDRSIIAFLPVIEYDYPNIERSLEPTKFNPSSNTVTRFSSGYLKSPTLSNWTKVKSWAATPLNQIKSWVDFELSKTPQYPIGQLNRMVESRFINSPLDRTKFRRLSSWLDAHQ